MAFTPDGMPADLRPETVLVEAGRPPRAPGAPVNVPLSLSATFHAGGALDYARAGTDILLSLEAALGALERGTSLTFGSGVAATAAVLDELPSGSRVVIPSSFYNFHTTVFADHQRLGRLVVQRVDVHDLDAVAAALPGNALLWLELPTNPMLRVPDLPTLADLAHTAGALCVVDATVATPLGIQPLRHGADVVIHSATKSIGGHSDLMMGVLSTTAPELTAAYARRRELTGALPGTLEAFLALRGLRTLSVRRERAQANAGDLASRLQAHPAVRAVHYPGLPDHPDTVLTKALLDGAGSLLSFEVAGDETMAEAVCGRTRLIINGTSLGSVESLIEWRGGYPGEVAQGTPANLVRLSVGIEHVEDLWADLDQALTG